MNHWASADRYIREHVPAPEEALACLEWFRQRLPEDWAGWGQGHNLARELTTGDAVPLARALKGLTDPRASRELLGMLTSPDWVHHISSRQMLSFIAGFLSARCVVDVIPTGRARTPDISVQLNGRPVVIEFTVLHRSELTARSHALQGELDQFANRGEVVRRGCVTFEFLPQANIGDAWRRVADIKAAASALSTSISPASMALRDLVNISFAPGVPARPVAVTRMPPLGSYRHVGDLNDFARLRRTIEKKCWRQLRGPGANVLVVCAPLILALPTHSVVGNATIVAGSTGRDIEGMPSVSAVLVYEELGNRPPPSAWYADDAVRFFHGPSRRNGQRVALLVHNRKADVPLSAAEGASLVGPDAYW